MKLFKTLFNNQTKLTKGKKKKKPWNYKSIVMASGYLGYDYIKFCWNYGSIQKQH